MELHDLLVKTRNKIEGHWTTHNVWDSNGNMCIIGGFYCAVSGFEPLFSIDGMHTKDVIGYLCDEVSFSDQATLALLIKEVYQEEAPLSSLIDYHLKVHGFSVFEFLPFLNDECLTSEEEILWLLDELIKRTAPEPEEIELTEPLAQKELVNA